MTVQEVFNTPAIRALEIEILTVSHGRKKIGNESEREVVKSLLGIRRDLLNSMFVLDTETKALLSEFNEALSRAVIDAAHQAECVYKHDWSAAKGEVKVYTNCYLGYKYSSIHPIQTIRAKKMWEILSGCIDEYDPLYKDGVDIGTIEACGRGDVFDAKQINQLLYASNEPDNWNEGLDREVTKDMHLTMQFHNLFDHCLFSIYDLLWVRDFDFETHLEYAYKNYQDEEDYELDWDACDYLD